METVPVSVVIPALNREGFIADAVASVHAQNVRPREIVVVDNGSTDRTAAIARELGAVVVEESRRGASQARNAGIVRAAHPWIALLDSDDLWDQNKLERQWAAIQTCPDAALVGCYYRVTAGVSVLLDESDEVWRERWSRYRGAMTVTRECRYFPQIEPGFVPGYLPSCSDAMIRRDVFDTVGMFEERLRYLEDIEFFLRALATHGLAIVEKTLVTCRRHDQNHTGNLDETRDSGLELANLMLQKPSRYPAGAAEAYRDRVKKNFVTTQRDRSAR